VLGHVLRDFIKPACGWLARSVSICSVHLQDKCDSCRLLHSSSDDYVPILLTPKVAYDSDQVARKKHDIDSRGAQLQSVRVNGE
jgi:hypothetical protein